MKTRPIIFSTERVRAILAGNTTQTRRVVKFMHETPKLIGQAAEHRNLNAAYPAREKGWVFWQSTRAGDGLAEFTKKAYATGLLCPYGEPGDRLWVRETFTRGIIPIKAKGGLQLKLGPMARDGWQYAAWYDGDPDPWGWFSDRKRIPSIFMPRWASRITLEIVNVRVERLQEISVADAIAEGVYYRQVVKENHRAFPHDYLKSFSDLWNSINAKRGWPWESNPWIWVIEFRMLESAEASNPIGQ